MKRSLVILWLFACGNTTAADINGRVAWLKIAQLGVPVSGVVEKISVQPGQQVTRGEALVVLDQRPFQNQLRRTRAVLEGSEPALQEAKRELERAEELYDRAVSSDHELNTARILFAATDAANRVARSERVSAAWDLEHSTLKAPFDGLVVAVHASEGEVVISTQQIRTLVSLADTGSLAVVARVPARQAGRLMNVDQVTVRLDGETTTGRVKWLVPIGGEGETEYRLAVNPPIEFLRGRLGHPVIVEIADE